MKLKNNLLGIRLKGIKTQRHSRTARLLHWVLAPSFLLLAASGFYMSNPSRFKGFSSMDSARKTHFIAQYFFGFYFVARAYYATATKDYRKLYPATEDVAATPRFLSYELFLRKKKPEYPKYNPGQKLLFALMTVFVPLQIITGAALYSSRRLQKLSLLFGGLGKTRLAHYLGAVGFTGLVAVHMYFALTGSIEKLKSIFTGFFKPK